MLPVLALQAAALFPPRIEHLSLEHGLSQSGVQCILQDSRGFLWIGTNDGLNRYDGVRFTVFSSDPQDADSLSDSFVTALFEDRSGTLWVGTDNGGLNRYDAESGTFRRYLHQRDNPHSISHNCVLAITQAGDGDLWIGTWGGGLNRFRPADGKFTAYRHDPNNPASMSHDHVWTVLSDNQGRIWSGTWSGLNCLDPRSGRISRFAPGSASGLKDPGDNVAALTQDASGLLWIGSLGGGLFSYDPRSGAFRHYPRDPEEPVRPDHNWVRSLAFDLSGQLWVGTARVEYSGMNLGLFDGKQYVRTLAGAVVLSNVMAMTVDQSGIVWVGTRENGLFKVIPPIKKFSIFNRLDNRPASPSPAELKHVTALCEDRSRNVWIGTKSEGLFRLDADSRRAVRVPFSAGPDAQMQTKGIYSIGEDFQGTIWIGTLGAGLFRYDPKEGRCTAVSPAAKTPYARVMAILSDPDGTLWLGSWGEGIMRLPPGGRLSRYLVPVNGSGDSPAVSILCLLRTRDGDLWAGTYGQGLERYSGGTLSRYQNDPEMPGSLGNNRVLSLYEDAEGALWIGTWGGGLNRLSPNRREFACFTEKDGLANNTVYSVMGDARGDLWLSTNRGLCRFSPSTRVFRTYTTRDGLLDNEFIQGAYALGPSGRMYVGSAGGFVRFLPGEILDNPHVPPVAITAFRLFGFNDVHKRVLPGNAAIRLAYNENFFTIDFAALDFIAPEKNSFRYRLEGLNSAWSPPASEGSATYTNVPPGRYTFHVQAANSDGVWNHEGVRLKLVIPPPLWATWWAWLLYVFAGTGGVWLFFASRIRAHRRELQSQKLELERERQISETLRRAEESSRVQRAALQSAANAIAITDPEGKITWVNAAYADFTGKDAESSLDQPLDILNPELLPAKVHLEIWSLIRAGNVWRGEQRFEHRDGTSRIEEETITPVLDPEGRITHYVAILQDVTEKKRLQQQLLQSQKMEGIGTLAGGIAHDFNNLLGIITGFISLLHAMAIKDERICRCVEAIGQAAQRGAGLVRQILTFARKSEILPEPIDINNLIRELILLLRETFPRSIVIETDLQAQLPMIQADHGQLHQALLNLAVNARDAMAEGGTLRFATSLLAEGELGARISGAESDACVCVEITDTGAGMDALTRGRIFEPFFTTKGPGSGTGLGLSVVYGIVQAHKGFIEVESTPGTGSAFRLHFPATPAPSEAAQPAKPSARKEKAGGTILIVEDEDLLIEMLESILTMGGYRVIRASDGQEAVRVFKERHREIDLVLTDYGLPKLNGGQIHALLKEINPKVKTIIASGYLEAVIQRRLLESGVTAFVQKPFSAVQLLDLVASIITPPMPG